ncbi:hypothetical protein [Sphingomicrobium arenosum]|uniref:hypothetical protein n=1 Tax=Sphingomicrobium arenosum TaxID=2233861 RepID=UPI002240EF06|nr:hypothetical protein [Sphingomicrobium arenosum]
MLCDRSFGASLVSVALALSPYGMAPEHCGAMAQGEEAGRHGPPMPDQAPHPVKSPSACHAVCCRDEERPARAHDDEDDEPVA